MKQTCSHLLGWLLCVCVCFSFLFHIQPSPPVIFPLFHSYLLLPRLLLPFFHHPFPSTKVWHHHRAAGSCCDVEVETWKMSSWHLPLMVVWLHRGCYGYIAGLMCVLLWLHTASVLVWCPTTAGTLAGKCNIKLCCKVSRFFFLMKVEKW